MNMNRNTWIIIICAVIVIFGLVWIFNRGPATVRPVVAAAQVQQSQPADLVPDKLFKLGDCTVYEFKPSDGKFHYASLCSNTNDRVTVN